MTAVVSAAPIVSFTPSAMDPAVLEAIFVEREPLVKRMLATIRAGASSAARHHWLLVGPRGIGKTHVVSILYHRIAKDARLRKKLAIAWLREDSWEIASYLDLLEAMHRALGAEDDFEVPDLLGLDRREAERQAEQSFLDQLGGRTLLLIAENLDEVFGAIGIEGQRSLRAFIETHDKLIVLATAPALFGGVSLHRSPFYGFFTVEHLAELDLAAAKELLVRIARLRDDTALADFLQTPLAESRLRVVAELAGGHPRIWVLFANCLSIDLIDELVPVFLKMLDDLTPYYQERMRSLPPQQRRIVMQLATFGGAQPVRDIAAALTLDQRAVAKQLGDLQEKAFVRKVDVSKLPGVGDGRLRAYELREPLLRLSLDVKESRGKPIRMIVAFLREWYGNDIFDLIDGAGPLAQEYVLAAVDEVLRVDDSGFARRVVQFQLARTLGRIVGREPWADSAGLDMSVASYGEAELPGLRDWLRRLLGRASQAGALPHLAAALALTAALIDVMTRKLEPRSLMSDWMDEAIVGGGRIWLSVVDEVTDGFDVFARSLRLAGALMAWAEDRDRAHLMALPIEERRLLQDWLGRPAPVRRLVQSAPRRAPT